LHGVLVTYRRADHLENTLRRLAGQTRQLDTLVVVDNDPDESARCLVQRKSDAAGAVTYLPARANLGPAGGIALGMQHALTGASDSDWLVLLDDDDPPPEADDFELLEELGTRLRGDDPRVAGVGASGTRFDLASAQVQRVPDSDLVGPVPTACIGGNQLPFYSVHAVRKVGPFDARLFFGLDDLEFGLRLWAAGFTVYAHGELWARNRRRHQRVGLETPPSRLLGEPSWRRYYSLRNMIVILHRHGRRVSALRLAARSLAKPLYNLPRRPRLAVRHLALCTRAVIDGYRGRLGMTVRPQPKV
jgi:GT2 family glycosyltransferase